MNNTAYSLQKKTGLHEKSTANYVFFSVVDGCQRIVAMEGSYSKDSVYLSLSDMLVEVERLSLKTKQAYLAQRRSKIRHYHNTQNARHS